MAKVIFYTATASQYAALTSKNESALYFKLYKGGTRFTFPVKQVTTFPATGEAGIVYVNASGEAKIWAGSAYITIGGNVADNFLTAVERHVVTAGEAGTGIYVGMLEGTLVFCSLCRTATNSL